ncbi:MAG: response regulator transcription factor [Solirubrobacteraceae bacterium]
MGAGKVRIQVAIVEDSLFVREGLQRMLELDGELEVCAVCEDAAQALAVIERAAPDVVITDIRMPPDHRDEGIRLAERLRVSHPSVGVLVLSQHASPEHAVALLGEDGSGRGYLLKDRVHDLAALTSAIRTVAAGGCQVDSAVLSALMSAPAAQPGTIAELTPREREILGDIAEGCSNQAIAQRRVLTRGAVEKHATSIFNKLGLAGAKEVNRRVKAVLIYLGAVER